MGLGFFEAIAKAMLEMKIDDAMSDALHGVHLNEHDCDYLAGLMENKAESMGIAFQRRTIIAKPAGADLGHINLPRQSMHVVVDIGGKIYDPYFNVPLPIEKYLGKVYEPAKSVEVVVLENNSSPS